jgi:uncharacterized protein
MKIEVELSLSPDEYEKLPNMPGTAPYEKDLREKACSKVKKVFPGSVRCIILKKSIDARKKRDVRILFKVCLTDDEIVEPPSEKQTPGLKSTGKAPVVIGFGPAGIFAALILARNGLQPIIIERGRSVNERARDVEVYFSGGKLLPYSNVQFGEGGAGTFSDGKLYSGISDARRGFVLDTFINAGAPPDIRYLSHPHIGTDRLRGTVINVRKEILSLGGTILFERTADGLVIDKGRIQGVYHASSISGGDRTLIQTDNVILAIGHSARDTYTLLARSNITMTPKPFSVGVRIEHPQELINRSQYGPFACHPALPAAEYKLVSHTATGRALYTFCMCPGGYVVAGASAEGQVVTNGMSNYLRNGRNANSAILVGVDSKDFSTNDILAGMHFQESLEKAAFIAGGSNGMAPCQRMGDFLSNVPSTSCGMVEPTYRPGVTYTNIRQILPDFISETLCQGVIEMNRKISGFSHPDSLLTGVETRSSAPVRIIRDEALCSPDAVGLYPCGEGAGYAGGIMSSAIDGIRCAERILERAKGQPG